MATGSGWNAGRAKKDVPGGFLLPRAGAGRVSDAADSQWRGGWVKKSMVISPHPSKIKDFCHLPLGGRFGTGDPSPTMETGGGEIRHIQKYRKGEFIMSKEDKEVLDMANGVREKTEPVELEKKVSGGVGKYLPKGSCRRWPEFGRLISEVAGWTGFGAVVLGGMLAGVFPMGAAVPVFIGCFGWVAIRVDRFFRG